MNTREGFDLRDPDRVRHLFLRFCKAGATLEAQEVGQSAYLAEVLKQHLFGQAKQVLKYDASCSVLFSYQSDATS